MSSPQQDQVVVSGQELIVERWRTADLAVLTAARAAAERGEDLGSWLTRVVAIGAAAVNTAGTVTDLARIDTAMDRLDRQVRASLDAALARLGVPSMSDRPRRRAAAPARQRRRAAPLVAPRRPPRSLA